MVVNALTDAGSGASVSNSVLNFDDVGYIELRTGTGSAQGDLFTAAPGNQIVGAGMLPASAILIPLDSATQNLSMALTPFNGGRNAQGFTATAFGTPADNTTYRWIYKLASVG